MACSVMFILSATIINSNVCYFTSCYMSFHYVLSTRDLSVHFPVLESAVVTGFNQQMASLPSEQTSLIYLI